MGKISMKNIIEIFKSWIILVGFLVLIFFISKGFQEFVINSNNIHDFFLIYHPENLEEINDVTEFELAKILFIAQITLSVVFITYLGLLVQFFESNKMYLSIDVRKVIFNQSFLSLSLSELIVGVLLLNALNYYFLAHKMLASVVSLFMINLFLVCFLVLIYANIVSGKRDISKEALKIIEKDIYKEVKKENTKIRIKNEEKNETSS